MHIQVIWYGNMAKAVVASLTSFVQENNISDIYLHIHDNKDISTHIAHLAYATQWIYPEAECILLGVKPQSLDTVDLSVYTQQPTLISLLAWTTIETLSSLCSPSTIVRTMPSMLMKIWKGSTWRVQQWDSDVAAVMKEVFAHGGYVYTYEKESQLNDHAALFGSWPAYIPMVMELMAQAAQSLDLGLSHEELVSGIYEMVLWTTMYMHNQNIWAKDLMTLVMSKGWTTQAFRESLQDNWGKELLEKSMLANIERAEELSQ